MEVPILSYPSVESMLDLSIMRIKNNMKGLKAAGKRSMIIDSSLMSGACFQMTQCEILNTGGWMILISNAQKLLSESEN